MGDGAEDGRRGGGLAAGHDGRWGVVVYGAHVEDLVVVHVVGRHRPHVQPRKPPPPHRVLQRGHVIIYI